MTRSISRFSRFYAGGYDLSGETRSIGPLSWEHDQTDDACLDWEIKGGYCGSPTILTGQVNTILRHETDASLSPLDWLDGMAGTNAVIMAPIGEMAAPVAGVHTWMTAQRMKPPVMSGGGESEMTTVTLTFAPSGFLSDSAGTLLAYNNPWGRLIHAKAARTAANTATGYDWGASTTHGGWMMAQIFAVAGTGSVTITAQHASTNSDGSFSNITGLTTGAVADTSIPTAVIAQAATTATIERYTRWQISLSGITSVTFALSLARGRI